MNRMVGDVYEWHENIAHIRDSYVRFVIVIDENCYLHILYTSATFLKQDNYYVLPNPDRWNKL